jgi:tRNA-Thr(GGU) m(6)t(6)A37 methyltransferase TsaA
MSPAPTSLSIEPIATVISPYREKFGIPRQAGLVPAAQGYLQMHPGYDAPQAFEGIEGFSHLWVIFGFHECGGLWRQRVRPPRLGGNREVGVFATRSPFRPNNLGLSVLRFEGVEQTSDGLRLKVTGLDMQHGTPVYDIKPYVPYADSLPQAVGGFASQVPEGRLQVGFAEQARVVLDGLSDGGVFEGLIRQSLELDPRPAYRQGESSDRLYGMRLGDYDVRWRVTGGEVSVEEIRAAQ